MPNRPPNWRWERARWFFENNKVASPKKEDPFVVIARKFQAKLYKTQTEAARQRLAKKFPGIFWSYHIYSDETSVTKYQIEARLLAGDNPERISKRCFISSPDIVRWYECLFFNVSDALDSHDYLCGIVVGRSIYSGIKEKDFDVLWKLYGIASRGRPEILDDLLTTISNPISSEFFADDVKNNLNRKAAIASRITSSSFDYNTIFEAYTKLKELSQENQLKEIGYDFQEHVKTMLNTFGNVFSNSLQQISSTTVLKEENFDRILSEKKSGD
ncbi:MAG: hypothetical protein KatS3mg035_1798 [Bacteroidia bacterium]|nr:MAG: hypothetical protein KatS3mg035_1798 [Bacteroidia bacterium]